MSRSGYLEDGDGTEWDFIRWRGQVASATRGKRGQKLLRAMLAALDAMPDKELITTELEADGAVCALGAIGRAQGLDLSDIDPDNEQRVARVFDIAPCLAQEIVYFNDEVNMHETPRARFERMRAWVVSKIVGDLPSAAVNYYPST
jgi:hypothetical protein